jgi:hypothetical protein
MRKSKVLTFIFIVICFMLVSGCSMSSSSDRTSLTVDKALIGHWISQGSDATNYYISSDKLIKVQKDGTTEQMTYVVSETNNNTNEIKIHLTTADGSQSDKKMKFTTDKTSMTETTEVLTVVTSTVDFKYADAKTAP